MNVALRMWLGVVIGLAGLAVIGRADYWVQTTPLPEQNRWPMVGELNGALYALGGMDNGNMYRTNAFRFDGTNWAEVRGLPAGKGLGAAVALNGALYIIGARNESGGTNCYRFDGTNYTELASLPTQHAWFAAAAYQGSIYVIGGYQLYYPYGALNNVYRYDPAGTNWVETTPLPANRYGLAAAVLGGYLYAFGGCNPSYSNLNVSTNVFRFNGTNWTEVAGLPSNRMHAAAAVWNDRLYAIGGMTENRELPPVIYRFDGTNWAAGGGIDRAGMGAGVLNGTMYAVGGSADSQLEHGRSNAFYYTTAEILPAPSNLTASLGTYTNKVALSWTAMPAASWYEIWRNDFNNVAGATGGGGLGLSKPADAGGEAALNGVETYDDGSSRVYEGCLLYYWVRAVNVAGVTSAYSRVAAGYCKLPATANISQPAPGDYDGDGMCDPAVYHLDSGLLTIWMSSGGYARSDPQLYFKANAAGAPAPADFDGDRRTDPATFDFTTGQWTAWLSGAGYQPVGIVRSATESEDIAAAADFDGDGRGDLAVYQASACNWTVWFSSAGFAPGGPFTFTHSLANAAPAPGRYDGAARASPAVHCATTNAWLVWLAGSGYAPLGPAIFPYDYGRAVPGDYDGDGVCDPAVFYPMDSMWFFWISSQGYALVSMRLL